MRGVGYDDLQPTPSNALLGLYSGEWLNRAQLSAELDSSFPTEIALRHLDGGVFAGNEPAPLDEVVRRACDNEDEYEEYADEGFEGLGLEDLLSFDWEGGGPGLGSGASLELLRLEPRKSYVAFRDEAFGVRIFAAVSEPVATFLPGFIESFFSSNGTAFGGEAFGSIPTGTLNFRPDLIPERCIRDGYRGFLNWASEHHYGGWDSFDPLDWAADSKEDAPSSLDLADRLDDVSSREQENEILLDLYFLHCYDESR